jgi:hypothetical protein
MFGQYGGKKVTGTGKYNNKEDIHTCIDYIDSRSRSTFVTTVQVALSVEIALSTLGSIACDNCFGL